MLRKIAFVLSVLLLLIVPRLLFAQDDGGGTLDAATSLSALLTYAFTIVSSMILGAVKSFLESIDVKLANWIKPFQPAIVGILGVLLPLLCGKLGIEIVPADVLAAAPLGTVIAVVLREILKRWQASNEPVAA